MPIVSDLYYHLYQGSGFETLPVVLLHGAGGTHLSWPPEVRRLAGRRVFALDLPGHGKSPGRGQQSIAAYARRVMEWLGVVGLNRAAFVGHSMGGAIALEIALQYPENVLALGLLATGARLPIPPDILADAASPTTFRKAYEGISHLAFSSSAEAYLIELVVRRMAELRQSVMHGDLLACNEYDATAHIGRIRQPALVLCGADDRMTPVRFSQYLADTIPSGRLVVVPAAGHMAMLERPQVVADALGAFLSGIPYYAG
jgi:pimeloyl-ACP methyl ester carboxylesterase